MDSHKVKSGNAMHKVPPRVESALRNNARINARIVQSKFVFGGELSIVDDDCGIDPYNNTGAHCIIKQRDVARE
jgi:hypothetical protein